jgi:hypothetical protein
MEKSTYGHMQSKLANQSVWLEAIMAGQHYAKFLVSKLLNLNEQFTIYTSSFMTLCEVGVVDQYDWKLK